MQSYTLAATRLDSHGARMSCKAAELLCWQTPIMRVGPQLGFLLRCVTLHLSGARRGACLS
jgi:hypothetical protein